VPFYPYQGSFAGGEISSRLYGQTSSPWYKNGVEFSENFLHLPQGPARYRIGSSFLTPAAQNGNIRLIPFNVIGPAGSQSTPDFCLELTAGEARLLNDSGVVQLSASGQLLLNNDFTGGTANWTTQGGYTYYDWMGSQAQVTLIIPEWDSGGGDGGGPIPKPPLPPPVVSPRIWQKLTAVAGGSYRLQVSFPPLSTAQLGLYTPKQVTIRVGTTLHATDIYTSAGHYNDSVDVNITVPGLSSDVYVEFGMTGGPLTYAEAVTVNFPRLSSASTGDAVLTGQPWTEDMLPGIQYAQDIKYGMVLVHPLMPPQKVIYTGAGFSIAPIVFTDPPADWVTGNYPSCVDIWQSRLWLANTPDEPTTMWASKVNNYVVFTAGTNPDDPIELTLATKGSIKWIRGKQSFLIGTELHEDVVVSATQVVSSQDAQLIRQSGYGSAPIQAQEIGDQVLFVSRDQIKLRSLNFNFDTQAWLAHDISYFAQGITLPGITDVAYARDPDNTVFVLITDGTMRMCTYDRLAEVTAWSRWRTQGQVKAICATIDPTGTTIWLAVNRNGTTFIEQIPPFTVQTPIYLDSYVEAVPTVYTPVGETTNRLSIPAGSHLEGFLVGVVVDGSYYGQYPVAGGLVDIPFGGSTATLAQVGLVYTGTIRTLPLDGGVMYGSSAGLKKSRTKIYLRLLPGSVIPSMNGQIPASRLPSTPMNTNAPIPDEDWDQRVTNVGWDNYGRVTIIQNIPFRCDVAAVFGRAEVVQN